MKVNFLWFLLPLLAVTVSLTWLASLPPASSPELGIVQTKLNCPSVPEFRPGYQLETGSLRQTGKDAFVMQGEGWVQADICRPSVLVIDAEGQVGDGAPPILSISVNGTLLREFRVTQRQTLRVPLVESGRVMLGYFNDYYRSEARHVTLEAFQQPGKCALKVVVPSETGGTFNTQTNTANLVSDVPMTVTPCEESRLAFQVVGVSGGGQFPKLEIQQQGKTLRSVEVKAVRQHVEFAVTRDPVTIRLTNPYFKELEDRNLILHHIQVIAQNSP